MSYRIWMMFSLFIYLMLGLFLGAMTLHISEANAAQSVEGYWLTENERAVVEIKACREDSMCGQVYWIIEGGLQQDIHNEDESLRTRPICGLEIMGGFEEDDPGEWEDGFIYKADDGDLYDADIELQEDGTLKLRGYLGISLFGKTQVWNRVNPRDYPRCTPQYN